MFCAAGVNDQAGLGKRLHHDTRTTGMIQVHMGGHHVFDLPGGQLQVIQ